MQITEPKRFIECIIAPAIQRGRVRAADHPADLEEERPPAAHRPADADGDGTLDSRRESTAACWCRRATAGRRRLRTAQGGDETAADRGRDGRPALRLAGVQARQEQRHRAGEGRHGRRRRGRADEPGRFGPHGGAQGRRTRPRGACWRPMRSSPSATTSTRRPRPASRPSSSRAARCATQDSIEACDEHGLAMVFTGVRHFRH